MRRRCLDFEMAGMRRKNTNNGFNNSSSTVQSDDRDSANDSQLLPAKRNGDSQRCILPGIGLHLNALATLKDYRSTKNENMSSGRQLSLPGPASVLQHSANQEQQQSMSASAERDLDPQENGVQSAEDNSRALVCVGGEDFNHNSPRKKKLVAIVNYTCFCSIITIPLFLLCMLSVLSVSDLYQIGFAGVSQI